MRTYCSVRSEAGTSADLALGGAAALVELELQRELHVVGERPLLVVVERAVEDRVRTENMRSGGIELGEFASTARSTNLKAGTLSPLARHHSRWLKVSFSARNSRRLCSTAASGDVIACGRVIERESGS